MIVAMYQNANHVMQRLGGSLDGDFPSKQEKMATTKSASIRPKNPVETSLDGVSHAYTSNLDRSAMWTARGEHSLLTIGLFGAALNRRGAIPERRRATASI